MAARLSASASACRVGSAGRVSRGSATATASGLQAARLVSGQKHSRVPALRVRVPVWSAARGRPRRRPRARRPAPPLGGGPAYPVSSQRERHGRSRPLGY
eukprot:146057-Prymnesium_polylepis.1